MSNSSACILPAIRPSASPIGSGVWRVTGAGTRDAPTLVGMRVRAAVNGLTVLATAGTYVVLIGMDFDSARANELLGFSIQRTNHATGETYWMWNDILRSE